MQNGEQDVAALAAEELAALGTAGADGGDAPLDDDVDDDDAPAATVHQNSDTGAVELDIDISVLDRPRPPAIVTRLLGSNWLVRAWPDGCWRHCIPQACSSRRLFRQPINTAINSMCHGLSGCVLVPRYSRSYVCVDVPGARRLRCIAALAGNAQQAGRAARHCNTEDADAGRLQAKTGNSMTLQLPRRSSAVRNHRDILRRMDGWSL